MHFHYHLQREELLVVLEGTLALRTADGWEDVGEGEVRAFPRGERGVHGNENRTNALVRLLMFSEQNAPNVSVYPDAEPGERRFGGLQPRRRRLRLRRRRAQGLVPREQASGIAQLARGLETRVG